MEVLQRCQILYLLDSRKINKHKNYTVELSNCSRGWCKRIYKYHALQLIDATDCLFLVLFLPNMVEKVNNTLNYSRKTDAYGKSPIKFIETNLKYFTSCNRNCVEKCVFAGRICISEYSNMKVLVVR